MSARMSSKVDQNSLVTPQIEEEIKKAEPLPDTEAETMEAFARRGTLRSSVISNVEEIIENQTTEPEK